MKKIAHAVSLIWKKKRMFFSTSPYFSFFIRVQTADVYNKPSDNIHAKIRRMLPAHFFIPGCLCEISKGFSSVKFWEKKISKHNWSQWLSWADWKSRILFLAPQNLRFRAEITRFCMPDCIFFFAIHCGFTGENGPCLI